MEWGTLSQYKKRELCELAKSMLRNSSVSREFRAEIDSFLKGGPTEKNKFVAGLFAPRRPFLGFLPGRRWTRHLKNSLSKMLLEAPHPYHVPDMPKEDIKLWGERIVRAMEYQVEDEMDGFHDPLEDHPKFHHTIRQALARAKIVDSSRGNWPYCHVIWKTAKEFLREEHGIVWFSPAEMNPGRIFD